MVTQELLKNLYVYNPDTGQFIRRIQRRSYKVGEIAGTPDQDGYLLITINSKTYKAHRLVWLYLYGNFPDGHLDHINGVKHDNRISNLRVCTMSQNQLNKPALKNSKTGVKGVSWREKTKRWRSCACINNVRYELGTYKTIEEAKAAYDEFAKKHHGEFYFTNESKVA